MQYVVFHPRLIPYLQLGLEIVELLLPARGLLCEIIAGSISVPTG